MTRAFTRAVCRTGLAFTICLIAGFLLAVLRASAAEAPVGSPARDYRFDTTVSRQVLENYLSRSITMEGLLNGRSDLDDNIRMLKSMGAKFIGRALCLWAGEANILQNLERAKQQIPKVHAADPEMVLQACIFEIVTTQVDQVPVPEWAFAALNLPAEKRNFRYADMLYPNGRFKDHWRTGQSVPDITRPETKLWFYFQGASYIDAGIWDWVRKTDANGYLQMPGSRTVRSPRDNMRWYYANNKSAAVPDGFGDEQAIRAIWAKDSAQ